MKQGQTKTPETLWPTFCDKCVGSLTSSDNHVTVKIWETGPTIFSPFSKTLEHLTICRYNYKGSEFYYFKTLRVGPV